MTEYHLTPQVTFPSLTISQDVAARKAARKQVLEKAWQTRRENYLQFEVILYRLKEGYPLEAIHDFYPWVEKKTLEGAIDEAIHIITTSIHAERVS